MFSFGRATYSINNARRPLASCSQLFWAGLNPWYQFVLAASPLVAVSYIKHMSTPHTSYLSCHLTLGLLTGGGVTLVSPVTVTCVAPWPPLRAVLRPPGLAWPRQPASITAPAPPTLPAVVTWASHLRIKDQDWTYLFKGPSFSCSMLWTESSTTRQILLGRQWARTLCSLIETKT